MAWLGFDIKDTLAVVGVATGFVAAATAAATARWNRKAVIAEETLAALKQQTELLRQQAATTEANLKEQLAYYKDLSPADIQKQIIALKSLLSEQVNDLKEKLDLSNQLLREKSAEVSEQRIAAATMLGYGKLFFGINDAELLSRALTELVTGGRYRMIDFGEADLSIKAFYVGIMRLLIRSDDFIAQFTGSSPDYVLDHVVMPLLACAKYKVLEPRISETLERVFGAMETTPFRHEVSIYRQALDQARQGYDFSGLALPTDLKVALFQSKT